MAHCCLKQFIVEVITSYWTSSGSFYRKFSTSTWQKFYSSLTPDWHTFLSDYEQGIEIEEGNNNIRRPRGDCLYVWKKNLCVKDHWIVLHGKTVPPVKGLQQRYVNRRFWAFDIQNDPWQVLYCRMKLRVETYMRIQPMIRIVNSIVYGMQTSQTPKSFSATLALIRRSTESKNEHSLPISLGHFSFYPNHRIRIKPIYTTQRPQSRPPSPSQARQPLIRLHLDTRDTCGISINVIDAVP